MSRKKTHEEYVEQVHSINPNIVVVGQYIDARTPIEHVCSCGEKWITKPDNVLKGSLCRKCLGKRESLMQRMRLSEYKQKLALANNKVECIADEYINSQTKIPHKCLKCGEEILMKPNKALNGQGHRQCSLIENGMRKRIMPKAYAKRISKINPNIKLLSEYTRSTDIMSVECLVCGNKWTVERAEQLYKAGCPKCADKSSSEAKKLSQDEFNSRISDNIIILSKYNGWDELVDCKCSLCGLERTVTAGSLLSHNKYGCPRCAGNYNYTPEEFEQKFNSKAYGIELLGKYVNSNTSIKCRCIECGLIWDAPKAGNLLYGVGCPVCASSHGEKIIAKWLSDNLISYIPQKKFNDLRGVNGGLLSYDFHIPSRNMLIEFQGEQHEHPINGEFFNGEKGFIIQQEHDKRKEKYASKHGFLLLQIWYYEIDFIEQILNKNLNSVTVETVRMT